MPLKSFNEVKPGDKGIDYADESGTVIAIGRYQDLQKYDSTGAYESMLDCLDDDQIDEMVAVEDKTGNKLLYSYGEDGFGVYI